LSHIQKKEQKRGGVKFFPAVVRFFCSVLRTFDT
jgi:hypothetical protein